MMRRQIKTLAMTAALAAAGLGTAAAITACGTSGQTPGTAASASPPAGTQARAPDAYSYYRSMMGRYFGGSMMGGGARGWMMGPAGYRWMTGVTGVPGWMRGGHFPAFMMGSGMMGTGTSADPGKLMGRLWANAPGPRATPAQATRAGNQIPPGAHINRAARTITFTTGTVHVAAVASPAGGPDETFRIAGMVNPKITVPAGAQVSIQVINADPGTAHGLVITSGQGRSSWMPMMTSRPAFTGAALWFLGNPTAAGMHTGTVTFTAATPGTYHYLCPVPGHAQKGMTGLFTVSNTR
jgi:rusticyanin